MAAESLPVFGESLRKEFMLRPNTVFLNHASYGAMPRCVHERQISYLTELELQPDTWFRFNLYAYLKETIRVASEFIGAAVDDVFLMQNATKATNTVLKTFPMTADDAFMVTNWTYYAAYMTACVTADMAKGKVHVLELSFPIKDEAEIISAYDDYLSKHKDVKIALIDHITSPGSVVMPIKELTAVCHKHGVMVIIDGAQAPGQLPLQLQEYDADFYTGNFHKWVYCPRSCAFLWRNPNRKHEWLKPLVTSAHEKKGLFKAFAYEGTKDDTPYICVADGIRFYQRIGGMDKITSYTRALKNQAINYLEQKWKTKRLEVPATMLPPNLEMIRLPYIEGYSDDMNRCLDLQKLIIDKFDIQTVVVAIQGDSYIRLSIQVYTNMEDIVRLGDAVMKLSSSSAD